MNHEPPRVFSVVSWGCAATHWLAQTLDTHPDLRCFHDLNGRIQRIAGGEKLDGVDYARLLATDGLGRRAVGDVHGFARTTIADVRAVFGDRFRCAILVRDPLPRYQSQLALFRRRLQRPDRPYPWNVEYVKPIARDVGIDRADDDYAGWLVVHGANMLNAILDEREIAPVFRMEDLVSTPDALCSLVSTLTGDAVAPDLDWARDAVSQPRTHVHASGSDELSLEERDVLDRIVRPETWKAYRELGYAC